MQKSQQLTAEQVAARVATLADKVRPLLGEEDQSVVMSTLALLSGEALGSLTLAPQFSRGSAVQLFCQQTSNIAADTEDARAKIGP